MIYISAAPEYINDVKGLGKPLLHMAYSFDRPFPEHSIFGGMMAVYGGIRSNRINDIIRECRLRGCTGVVAGYGYSSVLETMRLAEALGRRNIRFYIMEESFVSDAGAIAVISTAISGVTLSGRLKAAVRRYGASHIALDFERLRHIFPLPSSDGNGSLLEKEEFDRLLRDSETAVSLSSDLCCKYFTCSESGAQRFVLFDDAETLKMKISLAASLGINEGFVMYPEWDIESLKAINRL
jgi:hypothetical protein